MTDAAFARFNAKSTADAVLAKARVPQRVPLGFHACWMKPGQIANW